MITVTGFRRLVRVNAARILVAAGTLAGRQVQTNRGSDVRLDDMPWIGVYTGPEQNTIAGGTTDSLFDAKLTLHVRVAVQSTVLQRVEDDLDTLIEQVKTALLTSADFWLPQPDGSVLIKWCSAVDVQPAIKTENAVNIGAADISFVLDWSDYYQSAIADTLDGIGVTIARPTPQPPAPVTLPLDVSITLQPPGSAG